MKKKNIILLSVIALLIIAAIIAIVVINNKKDDKKEETKTEEKVEKNETITISFEPDGGTEVAAMTIDKGSKITLPSTAKDGYNFLGWYDKEEQKVEDGTEFTEDTTLKAKWEAIKKDAKKMKVSFDTNGGNKISSITMECGKPLNLPSSPTKTGYKFLNWADKKGNKITKDSKLACADITLYAKWQKEEAKKEETKKEETKKEEPTKTWTCPDGYDIDADHKCTKKVAAKEKCAGEREYEYNGKCVTINYASRKDPQYTCGKTTVHTGGGHTEEVQGELFKMGTNYCFFKVVTDSYENNQTNCTSRGHKWNSVNNKCYYYRGDANQFVTSTCNHLSGYAHITNPNSYEGVNGLNGGCYPLKEKTKYCDSGYTLSGSTCTHTVDAIQK